MKRILYLTPQPPSLGTGGGRHSYANLRALCAYPGVSVDYVGPPIVETLAGLESLKIRLARNYRFGDKVAAALNHSASSLAGLFRELRSGLRKDYTLAFVETSRSGFAVRALSGGPLTICSFLNVEADYMASNSRGFSRLAAASIRRSEELSLRLSDHVLVLHREDLARLTQLYGSGCVKAKTHFHPVCAVEPSAGILPFPKRERVIIIPGTLDQPFNERGILKFLDECWPKLEGLALRLVVAGRNPRPLLKESVTRAGGTLVENPACMASLVRCARVVVVPDLGGAGMKLRVAEALSLGVPVVGTREGLLGYPDAHRFGRVVGTIAEMAPAIRELATDDALAENLGQAAHESWLRNYSYPAFESRLHELLGSWFAKTGRGTRQ